MKNVTLAFALATSLAFSASAMTTEIDTDGDGMASLAELQVFYPELTDPENGLRHILSGSWRGIPSARVLGQTVALP